MSLLKNKLGGMNIRFFFALIWCLSLVTSANAEIKTEPKSIGIFTYKVYGATAWDPDSVKTGITGSEEAVILIGQKLASLGYQVTVFGDPPVNSPYSQPSANPRYVQTHFDDGAKFDIAVSWRSPERAMELKRRANKVYFWPHDTCCNAIPEEQVSGFDDVLWLSQWQREQWISRNPSFAKFNKIFGNGIDPAQFQMVGERTNPYSCIYGSNYSRGLEILLDIWPSIKEKFPQATLDIYYGWQHWGQLTLEKEIKMRGQIMTLAALDVREHGMVGHEELNQAYARASLWAYPCIAWETFCITGLRAQLAGAVPVVIRGSGLQETVRHGLACSASDEYAALLERAMREVEDMTVDKRKEMGEFILQEYTWEVIASKWRDLFDS